MSDLLGDDDSLINILTACKDGSPNSSKQLDDDGRIQNEKTRGNLLPQRL